MSVRLADVIEVLDEAYPPRLAQSWDSVGLVCGDPQDVLDSVTIAVDATPAVVDEVPDDGLLLAHHPLLLRGVDTVAASTPKGALVHRLIRTGRSLFTAHTNADSASPGVSDALADALGLPSKPCSSRCRRGRSGQVGHLRAARERSGGAGGRVCGRRRPHRRLFALQLERRRHRAVPAARRARRPRSAASAPSSGWPKTGSRSSRPARLRAAVLAAMRAAHPYEEPAFDIFALVPLPSDAGLGRIGTLPRPEPLSRLRIPGRRRVAADVLGGARRGGPRHAGVAGRGLRRRRGLAAGHRRRAPDVQAYVTADLRHHPADEHRRASDVALIDVAHWASEFPWCEQAADVLRSRFGEALPVRVCTIRTDPWNLEMYWRDRS